MNDAHSALRDKALQFRDYLKSKNLNPNDWESFKGHFLQQYRSTTVDHSKATNLSVNQKSDERITAFGWRLSTIVGEFASSVPQGTLDTNDTVLSSLPNEILAHLDTTETRTMVTEWGKAISKYVHMNFSKGVSTSLRQVLITAWYPKRVACPWICWNNF